MKKHIWLVFLAVYYSEVVHGSKILAVFPVPVRSHYVMTKTILTALAAKGHEIDLYTIFPEEKKVPRIKHHLIPTIDLLATPLSVAELRSITVRGMIDLMFTEKGNGHYICREAFKSDVLHELKQSKTRYDLLLLELFVVDCFFGFTHIFKAPTVALTSSIDLPWGSHRIGNPDNPSYIPTYFGEFEKNMSLYERLLNSLTLLYAKYRHKVHLSYQQQLAKQFFGDDLPPLDDLVSNTSLMIVNSHFSLSGSRPTVPNVIEVAGIHIKEPQTLPKDIMDIIGKEKFVYFSFGSIVGSESLPLKKLQFMLNLLDELGYIVLWKADPNSIPKTLIVPKSVHVRSWMPQLDILCHPNIDLFITHSGLMGTQEAIYCGVPMLSVPMFADQFLNAKSNENMGIGLTLNFESITNDEIRNIMEQVIKNPMFKENVKKLSEKFKDRPLEPLEEAIYWIEYVLKYGGAPQLRSRSADLPFYQYYMIDIGIILTSAILFISYFSYYIVNYILKCRTRLKMNKEKQK